MQPRSAIETVQEFWRLMATNAFDTVAAVLAPTFILEWPQSRERIRGPAHFIQMNQEYPAHGRWQFTINRLIGGETGAVFGVIVSDVTVTDGVQIAQAISFFTVQDGLISRMVEYWPEPYPAPSNRAHLVEAML